MVYLTKFSYFCGMIELAQHIEVLLLENDCVIVPGLGGFVAHYTPATRIKEENLFLPPARIIGFNPQLKMNDGILVQSYMGMYGTNFSDATKIIEKEVTQLNALLHENGVAELPNVGELRYSIHGTYSFIPYDNKIASPELYGLDSFEMQELKTSINPQVAPFVPTPQVRKHRSTLPHHSYWSGVAAMIAILILFFSFSEPLMNTEVIKGNQASMFPQEWFEQIEKQSLVITPIEIHQKSVLPPKNVQPASTSITFKEVKVKSVDKSQSTVSVVTTSPTKRYHIIVASIASEHDAEAMVNQLKTKGFNDAKVIIGDGKVRISIESCATHGEAVRSLEVIRETPAYKDAWVLKK